MELSAIWNNRKEEDIQDCLEEAYSKLGYKVINLHKVDRSHEKGCDLECKSPSEVVYIQTKIKPHKKDIAQLKRLASSKADKKIYVYIFDPSVSFKKEMEKTKNVKFWDKEELHNFLIENQSTKYIRFLFLSTTLVRRIVDILEKIVQCESFRPMPLEDYQIKDWWIFKDRAVKLHTCCEYIHDYFTKKFLSIDRIEKKELMKYIEELSIHFDIINEISANDLLKIVRKIKSKYPQILSQYVKIASERSNWIGMPFYSRLKSTELRSKIEKWVIPEKSKNMSFYSLALDYLKNLEKVSKAIEDGVDWLHRDWHSQLEPRNQFLLWTD